LFGIAEEFQHGLGLVYLEEFLPELGRAQETADAGEEAQVFADIGSDEEEENLGRDAVIGTELHTGGMTAEDNDCTVHHADEGIPGMRERDAVTDAGGVEVLPFLQGAKQGLFGGGLTGDAGDVVDQFRQDSVTIGTPKLELDGGGGQQIGQKPFGCWSIAHDGKRIAREQALTKQKLAMILIGWDW